ARRRLAVWLGRRVGAPPPVARQRARVRLRPRRSADHARGAPARLGRALVPAPTTRSVVPPCRERTPPIHPGLTTRTGILAPWDRGRLARPAGVARAGDAAYPTPA